MAAEDAAVAVHFINDDVAQAPEKAFPSAMKGQNAGMKHIRVRH